MLSDDHCLLSDSKHSVQWTSDECLNKYWRNHPLPLGMHLFRDNDEVQFCCGMKFLQTIHPYKEEYT